MPFHAQNRSSSAANNVPLKTTDTLSRKPLSNVTDARAKAQRAKQDTRGETQPAQEERDVPLQTSQARKTTRQEAQARRRVIEPLIEAYVQDHIGGNHSKKTIEWHETALGLMRDFFQSDRRNASPSQDRFTC